MSAVTIHTVGLTAPGHADAGGWGAVIRCGSHAKTLSGAHLADTTATTLALTAVVGALDALTRPCEARVYVADPIIVKGLGWTRGWERRDWKTVDGKPVRDRELWERLRDATAKRDVKFRTVHSYAGMSDGESAQARAVDAYRAAEGAAA